MAKLLRDSPRMLAREDSRKMAEGLVFQAFLNFTSRQGSGARGTR